MGLNNGGSGEGRWEDWPDLAMQFLKRGSRGRLVGEISRIVVECGCEDVILGENKVILAQGRREDADLLDFRSSFFGVF